MVTKSLCLSFFLLAFLLHFHLHNGAIVTQGQHIATSESEALEQAGSKREALEIIIGGGGGGNAPAPSPESCPPPPPPPCPPPQPRLEKARRVLLNFTKFIADPNGYTRNWNEDTETCKFHGVKCATYPKTTEQAVSGLDLNQAAISSCSNTHLALSGILDRIPELTFFHVNSNNFSGAIPKLQIANFPYFFELDLSNNKLAGEFPKEVLQATQLVFLDLRFNNLDGPIPPQLFQMDLDVIFINNNKFSQWLPSNFGNTPARYMTFAHNQLSGPIPSSIGNASKTLTEVLFLGNKFEGCLPYEIGYLKKAVVFDVSKNYLTGPIPHSFSCLEKIRYLNLAQNKFYGTVPETLCQLPGLRNDGILSLSDNYFTDVGPECKKLIKSKVLDVTKNCIKGFPNQRSEKECYDFSCKKKPCQNEKYLSYIPCKGQWQQSTATGSPPEPVTYKSLKPHRLRL